MKTWRGRRGECLSPSIDPRLSPLPRDAGPRTLQPRPGRGRAGLIRFESGQQVGGFRCECWRADCIERLPLSGREWREVRSRANRFAVAPGHIASDVESVVEEYPHFWMVEKHGKAGELAEQLK